MRNKREFKDITPQGAGNVGDLAYGRKLGAHSSAGKGDFPGEWDEESGQCRNKPIKPIVVVQPRDNEFWERVQRPASKTMKKTINSKEYKDDVLGAIVNAYSKNHLRLPIGKLTVGKKIFNLNSIK